MWLTGQKYNLLRWRVERARSVKDVLLKEMGVSVRLMVGLKKGAYILCNGVHVHVNETAEAGDVIELKLPNEISEYEAENVPLVIHYEDEDVLVVEKPYDMVVHPTRNHLTGSMLNALLYYFQKREIYSKVRFVNRLDRYTSGVLIVAKNQYAHAALSHENALWHWEKEYIAVVGGVLEGTGTIAAPIAKSEEGIRRIICEDGAHAVTHYEALCSNGEATLVRVKLETGRTHQIRVHMSSIGHPLLGDDLYGGDCTRIQRQALHSARLGFVSPRKGEAVDIKIKLPEDIRELVEHLFGNSNAIAHYFQ